MAEITAAIPKVSRRTTTPKSTTAPVETVELTLKNSLDHLRAMIRLIASNDVKIITKVEDSRTVITVIGDEPVMRLLLGKHGQTIDALKRIAAVLSGRFGHTIWLVALPAGDLAGLDLKAR